MCMCSRACVCAKEDTFHNMPGVCDIIKIRDNADISQLYKKNNR